MVTRDEEHRGVARFVPAVGWLRRYERGWLRGDLVAGIAVTALVVPKNLGYAGIAGVPVQNGLYAAATGAIIYALSARLATSRRGRVRRWRLSQEGRCSQPASAGRRLRSWSPRSR
jgi:hypothetical protein